MEKVPETRWAEQGTRTTHDTRHTEHECNNDTQMSWKYAHNLLHAAVRWSTCGVECVVHACNWLFHEFSLNATWNNICSPIETALNWKIHSKLHWLFNPVTCTVRNKSIAIHTIHSIPSDTSRFCLFIRIYGAWYSEQTNNVRCASRFGEQDAHVHRPKMCNMHARVMRANVCMYFERRDARCVSEVPVEQEVRHVSSALWILCMCMLYVFWQPKKGCMRVGIYIYWHVRNLWGIHDTMHTDDVWMSCMFLLVYITDTHRQTPLNIHCVSHITERDPHPGPMRLMMRWRLTREAAKENYNTYM